MTGQLTSYKVRKWHSQVEEIVVDGAPADPPLRKAVVAVVIENPFAGTWQPDLSALIGPSTELGTVLGERAKALLGAPVESYGKGGLAGTNGEQEHVVACVTSVFGDALRAAIGGGRAWISSTTKVAGAGASLDLPLAFKDEVYVRSHYDTTTFTIEDAPRPDELVIAVAVASGPRPHARVGGMSAQEAIEAIAEQTAREDTP
jgi:hypothetical protein